jgi:hypothetical protein
MFAMARHMNEHPTLIGNLVGIAIAFVAIAPLEEMLELPGCPNLYWALTDLPSPLVSLDKGQEGERIMIHAELSDLDERDPMTADQIKKLIVRIDKLYLLDNKKKSTRAWLDARNKDEKVVRAARSRLVEAGHSEEQVQKFPADQVLLLDEKLAYEVTRDDTMKLMKLPAWQFEALAPKPKRPKEVGLRDQASEGLFAFLVPAVIKVRRAQGRLEQGVALLRHVEALRLYAAAHDGKLPAKLSDCGVPLPNDPFTGKPFRYEADGPTAHLRGSPPQGEAKIPAFNVHYQITIGK